MHSGRRYPLSSPSTETRWRDRDPIQWIKREHEQHPDNYTWKAKSIMERRPRNDTDYESTCDIPWLSDRTWYIYRAVTSRPRSASRPAIVQLPRSSGWNAWSRPVPPCPRPCRPPLTVSFAALFAATRGARGFSYWYVPLMSIVMSKVWGLWRFDSRKIEKGRWSWEGRTEY